jgi:hypothetical protein
MHLRTHEAAVLQTMSSKARCSGAVQTLTQSLKANCWLQEDPSPQQTLEVVLPRNQSRRTLEIVDKAAIVLPGAHRLLPTFARWHSVVLVVARGSLEASVERMEVQVDGMSHDDGLRTRGHHCTCPCLNVFTPSAIMSFGSLDTFISLVEYDASFA